MVGKFMPSRLTTINLAYIYQDEEAGLRSEHYQVLKGNAAKIFNQ